MWKFIWTYKLLIAMGLGLLYLVGSIMLSEPVYRCEICNSRMVNIHQVDITPEGRRTLGMRCPKCDMNEIRLDTDYPYIKPHSIINK